MNIKLEITMEINEEQIIKRNPSLKNDKGSLLAAIATEVEMQLMNDEYMTMSDVVVWTVKEIGE